MNLTSSMAASWFLELFSTTTGCSRAMAFLLGQGGGALRRLGESVGASCFSVVSPAATLRFMAIRSDSHSLVMAASELPFGPPLVSSSTQYFIELTTGSEVNVSVFALAQGPPYARGEFC